MTMRKPVPKLPVCLAFALAASLGCGSRALVEEPDAAGQAVPSDGAGVEPRPNVSPDDPTGRNARPTQLVNFSRWAFPGEDGRLVYRTVDKLGNRIPDYSHAGCMGGGVAIPLLPVAAVVQPDGDDADDTPRIQAAVDKVQGLTPDENGRRGAVLLTAGSYEIEGTIRITESGVVIRGEGKGEDGTVLHAPEYPEGFDPAKLPPARRPGPVILVSGAAKVQAQRAELARRDVKRLSAKIVDEYVPVGASTFTVDSAQGLKPGDRVVVQVASNDRWREAIRPGPVWSAKPDGAEEARSDYWGGRAGAWEAAIARIDGDKVTLDTPMYHAVAQAYGGGVVVQTPWPDARIAGCGVENLRLVSDWTPARREWTVREGGEWVYDDGWRMVGGEQTKKSGMVDPLRHRGNGLTLQAVRDGWVRDVHAKDFYWTGFTVSGGSRITVQDCAHVLADGEKYEHAGYVARTGFLSASGATLVQRCAATGCGSAFAFGGGGEGGARVFLDCRSSDDQGEGGARGGYQKGLLLDNCRSRLQSGSRGGAAWRDINTTFWNCGGSLLVVSTPPIVHPPVGYKWAIGCYATPEDEPGDAEESRGRWRSRGPGLHGTGPFAGKAVWDSWGATVSPRSLYEKQLEDRLGWEAVRNSRARTNWDAVNRLQEAERATFLPPVTDLQLNSALKGWTRVASDNCGVEGSQPHLVSARWRSRAVRGAEAAPKAALRTRAAGERVVFAYAGLDAAAEYRLVVAAVDPATATQKLTFDGGASAYLKVGNVIDGTVHLLSLPKASYADGKVVLVFEPVGATRFAGVCAMELWRK